MIEFDKVREFFEEKIAEQTTLPCGKEGLFDTNHLKHSKANRNPWCTIAVKDGDSRAISVGGDALLRFDGIVIVSIFVAFGTGSKDLRKEASTISNGIIQETLPGLQMRTPAVSMIGKTDTWLQCNLSVPFIYDGFTL